MAADKKRERELYSTEGLDSRQEVEQSLAAAQYRPSQAVQNAAAQLQQWQSQRPDPYQSAYQGRIDALLEELMGRESFRYNYQQDPLYRQYAQAYTQQAHNASADAAAQAAALTGGYGSSYAASAAQQAYQQQIGGLTDAIPTLYSLALDTYTSAGDAMETKLDQLNALEQNAQDQYGRQLEDHYAQLDRMGDAYNAAVQQDYQQYLGYLDRLDTLHGYYTQQEQAEAARRQQGFQGLLSVLGLIGDAVQLAITGTTGLGSLAGSLLNTGYGIYADNRQYEADRADAAWSQQMQQMQYQSGLAQQQYENDAAEREYRDTLAQRQQASDLSSQRLALAREKWEAQQAQAQQTASRETSALPSAAQGTGSGSGTAARTGTHSGANVRGPFTQGGVQGQYQASRLRMQGRTDREIRSALMADGYTAAQARDILEKLNEAK